MTKFLTSVLLLFSLSLFGQDAQPGYQIIKNDPGNLSYINIGIDPLFYSIDARNNNDAFFEHLNYNTFATMMFKNRLVADISYTRSYTKQKEYSTESSGSFYANPENGIQNFSEFSVVGKYYFLKKEKLHTEKVILKNRGRKSPTLKTKVNICNMWGLRGGICFTQKPIDGEDTDIYGYYTNDPGKTEIPFNTNYLTMAHFTTLSLGLSFCRVDDIILNVDGYGKKDRLMTDEFYIDVHHVIRTSFDDMKGTLAVQVTDVNRNNWGFKVGTMSSNNNRFGFRLGYEAGFNAVPVYLMDDGGANSFFFNIRLGIGFAQRFNRQS